MCVQACRRVGVRRGEVRRGEVRGVESLKAFSKNLIVPYDKHMGVREMSRAVLENEISQLEGKLESLRAKLESCES